VPPSSGKFAFEVEAESPCAVLVLMGYNNIYGVADVISTAKPSQAKVLTGDGDLHKAQVDVPPSISHSRF